MYKDSRIFVAGHRGLVGSALMRKLNERGYTDVITRTREQLDLTNQAAVNTFFTKEQPEYVVLAAAKVGGIVANSSYPADFIRDNLLIQSNVIDAAHRARVKKFLFLGSSCIYPKHAPQPLKEEYLLTGPLEPTNEAYAIAKIAGIKMCQAYQRQYGLNAICVMPTNLYGPGDNFDLETSHVLPALIRKFHESKLSSASTVVIWGTGTPRREFLHVDDLASACFFLMAQPDAKLREVAPDGIINVGAGEDIEIRELADIIRQEVGSRSEVVFDHSKPDGTPRKLLDVGRMRALGWTAKVPLREGIQSTYTWFRNSHFGKQIAA